MFPSELPVGLICNRDQVRLPPQKVKTRSKYIITSKGKAKKKKKTYVEGEGDFGIFSRGRGTSILLKPKITFSTIKFV